MGEYRRIVITRAYPFVDTVEIDIDTEGAEYIATVMEEEFKRTADAGAFSLAQQIREGLGA